MTSCTMVLCFGLVAVMTWRMVDSEFFYVWWEPRRFNLVQNIHKIM